MRTKEKRMQMIRLIIERTNIECQDDLLKELRREGFYLTQATLSRDLKNLKVAKASVKGGKYVYVLPGNASYKDMASDDFPQEEKNTGFISIEFSGNLGVIKTHPGHAASLAYYIDKREFDEILGTVAGDDTLMIILREGVTQAQVLECLKVVIPSLR